MKAFSKILFLIFILTSCQADEEKRIQNESNATEDIVFDQIKWIAKEGGEYLYRNQMLKDVLYNDTIRSLDKSEITTLLGAPDRTNENHMYYLISRSGIGAFTLNAKTMVVKIADDNSIEWIKVHE